MHDLQYSCVQFIRDGAPRNNVVVAVLSGRARDEMLLCTIRARAKGSVESQERARRLDVLACRAYRGNAHVPNPYSLVAWKSLILHPFSFPFLSSSTIAFPDQDDAAALERANSCIPGHLTRLVPGKESSVLYGLGIDAKFIQNSSTIPKYRI